MRLEEIRKVARSWIQNEGKFGESYKAIDDLIISDPKTAFRILEEIHDQIASKEPVNYPLLGYLAAGHIEDLLSESGEEIIDDIEFLAKNDKEFRKCLTGVWKNDITDEIYARVQKCADKTFKFA